MKNFLKWYLLKESIEIPNFPLKDWKVAVYDWLQDDPENRLQPFQDHLRKWYSDGLFRVKEVANSVASTSLRLQCLHFMYDIVDTGNKFINNIVLNEDYYTREKISKLINHKQDINKIKNNFFDEVFNNIIINATGRTDLDVLRLEPNYNQLVSNLIPNWVREIDDDFDDWYVLLFDMWKKTIPILDSLQKGNNPF